MATESTTLRNRFRLDDLYSVATSKNAIPYWFLLPYFFFFTLFYGWPLVWAPWMSLHEFSLAGSEWVGLANYERMVESAFILGELYNTLFIGVIKMPITIGFALVLAVTVNSAYIKYKKTWRTIILSPMAVSGVVMSLLFVLLLANNGVLNLILDQLIGVRVNWLDGSPNVARISVAMTMVIPGTAMNFLFFLAALAGIPTHLYQAAKIDGANRLQQFRYVTLPQIRPMLVLVIILETNTAMKIFAQPFVLTEGGPQRSTTTIVLRLYREAFTNLNIGYAAAIGVGLTVLLAVIMVIEYIIGDEDVR